MMNHLLFIGIQDRKEKPGHGGDVVMAWLELWWAVIAQPKIRSAKKKNPTIRHGESL